MKTLKQFLSEGLKSNVPDKTTLAAEHAGIYWNSNDAMVTYGNGNHYEKAEARAKEIEQHFHTHGGRSAVGALKAHSKAMNAHLNDLHFEHKKAKGNRLEKARNRLGVHVEPKEALAHAYRWQKGG